MSDGSFCHPEVDCLFALFEACSDSLITVDTDNRIVFANPAAARMFACHRTDLMGLPAETLLPGASRMRCPSQHPMRMNARRWDGGRFEVEATVVRPRDDASKVGYHAAVRDVTQGRLVGEDLARAHDLQVVGTLAMGLVHDLNNVLGVVMAHAEYFERHIRRGKPVAIEGVQRIIKACEYGATMTRQLLAMARQEKVAPRVVDVSTAIVEVEPMLRRLVGDGVRVVSRCSDGLRSYIRPGHVERIMMNLAANARDAMGGVGTLTINAWSEDDAVFIEVGDAGTGMDVATIARVSEPFFTSKVRGKGTGLGLATVRHMVQTAGGEMRIRSEPGVGTTVTVCLKPCNARTEATGKLS